ncbi:formate-nitrite transporter, partial [Enterococcus faecalis]
AFTAGNVIQKLLWAFIGNFIRCGLIMGLGYAWLDKDNKNLTNFD